MTISIYAHTASSYAETIFSTLGKGKNLAKLLYKTWMRAHALPPFGNATKLFEAMLALTDFSLPQITSVVEAGATKKIILDNAYEMVLLPMSAGWTLCLSSQVGCRMGCAFCQTGKMGLIRSLEVKEIVSQLFIAKHVMKTPVRNIVFMGMGEPFDNYEAVMQAVTIFTSSEGFDLGPCRITISTSGLVDKIERFAKQAPPSLNLALSINAPTDAKRNLLMPVNKQYAMEELKQAMHTYLEHPRRKILLEYVLIAGKNDAPEDAQALADYLHPFDKKRLTLNLIPYNPQVRGAFKTPDAETVTSFGAHLKALGFFVFIRDTKGDKIMAACGQLGKRNRLVFS